MSTRMLIDARHSEETRVTVVKGSRVEDFDYESSVRRQLKGNIYLARVTRVEPSLQAAFVEYGGNRHGFLAFSEIHPDYYQIPVEDREAIIAEETEAAAAEEKAEAEAAEKAARKPRRRRRRRSSAEKTEDQDAVIAEEADAEGTAEAAEDEAAAEAEPADVAEDTIDGAEADAIADDEEAVTEVKVDEEEEKDAEIEAAAARRRSLRALKRRYSIQEVIKRRQVLLIQVVKEERGNKGAALTTYLSLAGRYCVLMPNSTHSGGISRKISNLSDRKKLKQITSSLEVPDEMGLIVRTAGMNRTKTEIKRDYDYLLRLWNGIRDLTLQSTAPALIYEEGNLIKRTIRDLYTRDIDEIWVEGEKGYRAAKDFMKLLMPSHAKKVQHYRDRIPLYHRYQVENQLEAMYQPVVQLKSGGYIVINPTEALISIDVNSGRATKEHNIEETAVKTNIEAAEEVARQLRLRDMAGLVVIDFIDMEDRSNNRSVERRMKEALKSDRARIQVGRISSFGLMEMSRQRLRPNLLEVAMETCSHCAGTGLVRSVESAALKALRELEEEGIRNRSSVVRVAACPEVAIYLLNNKRAMLSDLESQYRFRIEVLAQSDLGPSDIELTRETGADPKSPQPETAVVQIDSAPTEVEEEPEQQAEEKSDNPDQPRKKRRRRRRRRRSGQPGEGSENQTEAKAEEATSEADESTSEASDDNEDKKPSRRRRGSRGGRRRKAREDSSEAEGEANTEASEGSEGNEENAAEAPAPESQATESEEKPRRRRRRVKKADETAEDAKEPEAKPEVAAEEATEEKPKPRRRRTTKKAEAEAAEGSEAKPEVATEETAEEKPKPRRRRRTTKAEDAPAKDAEATTEAKAEEDKPKRRGRPRKKATDAEGTKKEAEAAKPEKKATAAKTSAPKKASSPVAAENAAEPKPAEPVKTGPVDPNAPKKKGWWQRTFG